MAGHSKWANIKHKKARTDAKRGKAWSKCSKAIMVAAKEGGGDVSANLSLRYAVEEAKGVNMPKDTIERAIKKGAGETGGADYVSVRYEGYGPAGVAVIVDTLTDNRNRTAPEMRTLFTKSGGNLGATGCVGYMFEPKGILLVEEDKTSEEQIMELAIEAGAEDVELEDGIWTVTTEVNEFIAVKEAIDGAGIETTSAERTMIPNMSVEAKGADVGKVIRLIDNLEDHDDVQKVYTNLDASAEDLAAATE